MGKGEDQSMGRGAIGTRNLPGPLVAIDVPVEDALEPHLVNEIRQLRAQVAARDEVIGAMGQELRSRLAPLVLLAEQLDLFPPSAIDGPTTKLLAILNRRLDRFAAATDRIVDVAELLSGKLALEVARIDLGEVVTEVCASLEREAAAASIELWVTAESGATGWWDRARLATIVHHLVANAIQHSCSPTVEVEVRLDEHTIEIVVSDRGVGIEPGRRANLFDRMAQPRRTTRPELGLWTARTLCGAMGGSVRLDDGDGPGARFRVVLPRG
jgi:signal transduction histidine kinase